MSTLQGKIHEYENRATNLAKKLSAYPDDITTRVELRFAKSVLAELKGLAVQPEDSAFALARQTMRETFVRIPNLWEAEVENVTEVLRNKTLIHMLRDRTVLRLLVETTLRAVFDTPIEPSLRKRRDYTSEIFTALRNSGEVPALVGDFDTLQALDGIASLLHSGTTGRPFPGTYALTMLLSVRYGIPRDAATRLACSTLETVCGA